MQRQRQLLTVLAALVAMAPAATATWYAYGTYEPDTAYDTPTLMQYDPDTDPTAQKLYFNAYPTEYLTATNPNSGTLGSRVLVAGARQYFAVLGAWKDCNGDGYLGTAESALTAYRTDLLLSKTICPVGSRHNDGQWVHEYLPIGYNPDEVTQNVHPAQIEDRDARVWADFGLPGATAAATCPIAPLPHGTTAGTGWMLRYADCFVGKKITGTVNDVDSDGSLGLRFEDPNNPQYSSSLLNQHFPESLFGNPATGETGTLQLDSEEDGGEEERAATVWDCGSNSVEVRDPTGALPKTISVDDPTYNGETGVLGGNYGKVDENLTDDSGAYAWFATPAPALHDPADSWADTLNQTFRGFHVGGNDDYDNVEAGGSCEETGNDQDGDNTYSAYHQLVFFYADGDHEGGTQAAAKSKIDIQFQYYNGGEQDGAVGQVFGTSAPCMMVPPCVPTFGLLGSEAGWAANIVYITLPQSINRNTLQPHPGLYLTFYGKVGSTTFSQGFTTAGGSGTYGAEACKGATTGIVNGWECDKTKWYLDSNGNDIADPVWDIRVHETYHFRDIDCDDGTVARGTGIRASLVDLSEQGPCEDSTVGADSLL